MALKRITFTVGADKTLSPATAQDGGMQGDHNATELLFKFSEGLYTHLQSEATKGKLVYRFDAYDGEGTVHHSNTAVLTGKSVTYPLEYTVTCHGGLVKVELIITRISNEESAEVLHTEAAQVKLTFSPYSTGDKSQAHKDLSALADIVKDYAKRAEKAEEAAQKALSDTSQLSALFKSGSTFIFNGGNASGEIDANFIVDGEVSDYSTNAVQNKIIKAYVDSKYPVGSVWIGGKNGDTPIDPSEFFGGTWKIIDKEFKNVYLYDSDKELNKMFKKSADVGEWYVSAALGGHTIELSMGVQVKVAMVGDAQEINLGNLCIDTLGVEKFTHGKYSVLMQGEDANGAVMASFYYDGNIKINDFIKETIANGMVYLNISVTCRYTDMLNSFCDKFYWQRTE